MLGFVFRRWACYGSVVLGQNRYKKHASIIFRKLARKKHTSIILKKLLCEFAKNTYIAQSAHLVSPYPRTHASSPLLNTYSTPIVGLCW